MLILAYFCACSRHRVVEDINLPVGDAGVDLVAVLCREGFPRMGPPAMGPAMCPGLLHHFAVFAKGFSAPRVPLLLPSPFSLLPPTSSYQLW